MYYIIKLNFQLMYANAYPITYNIFFIVLESNKINEMNFNFRKCFSPTFSKTFILNSIY